MEKLKILLIEDNRDECVLLNMRLERAGIRFATYIVDTWSGFIDAVSVTEFDIVLSDHSLPGFNSLDALRVIRKKKNYIPFIVITGAFDEKTALQLLREGVDDYILKDKMEWLPFAIEKALGFRKMQHVNSRFRRDDGEDQFT